MKNNKLFKNTFIAISNQYAPNFYPLKLIYAEINYTYKHIL
jgi:hypothetical protein